MPRRSCSLCHPPYPDDLVRLIRSAKAGKPMTVEQFEHWLKDIR
jgi:hypothetical protein